jgi:hypothetical protein
MKKVILKLLALLPYKLPQGMAEFETWALFIIKTYDMPDNDSTRFALAVSILHLDSTSAYKPRNYFGKILIKGAASQIAGGVMQQLKERQEAKAKEEQAAAALQQQAEVTAPIESVVPDAKQQG